MDGCLKEGDGDIRIMLTWLEQSVRMTIQPQQYDAEDDTVSQPLAPF